MNDGERTLSAVWMSDQSGGGGRVTTLVDRVLAQDRDARARDRRVRLVGLLAVVGLMPLLVWAAAHGVTPLVRGAYALMAVGSAAIAAAEWMYLDWSRQALPRPIDTRSQLRLTTFQLARQTTLMKAAPIWASPVFIGVALIGVWQFTSGARTAALLVWAIAATGVVAAGWATQSTFVRLRERRAHLERLLADLE